MLLKVYSIFDSATKAYNLPFFMNTDSEAKRAFSGLANDRDTQIGRTPEDFVLFCIGDFDTEDGIMSPQTAEPLGRANEYVLREEDAGFQKPLELKVGGSA